jgi:hypothetical protein
VSFFAKTEAKNVVKEAQVMLENHAYLYEELKSDDPTKVFYLVFIICLLAETHVSTIKGHLDIPLLNTSSLHRDGITGVMGLCGTTVILFLPPSFVLTECSIKQIQRALMLLSHYDCQIEVDSKGKTVVKPPVTLNKSSGKLSTTAWSFSDQNWGNATRRLTQAAGRRSNLQRLSVMEKARARTRKLPPVGAEGTLNDESDDKYARICRWLQFHFRTH